jgi:sec-independent protein translocase protein TatA
MGSLGAPELILIIVVFLVFFGAKKIPELAKGLGSGIKEFRKGIKDVQNDIESESTTPTPTASAGSAAISDREREMDKRELELIKRELELRKKLEENK